MRSLWYRYMLLCPSEECPALSGCLVLAALNPVLSPRGAQEVLRLGELELQKQLLGTGAGLHMDTSPARVALGELLDHIALVRKLHF